MNVNHFLVMILDYQWE